MKKCTRCGSFAINQSLHGREQGKHTDLCDVCYWRAEVEELNDAYVEASDQARSLYNDNVAIRAEIERLNARLALTDKLAFTINHATLSHSASCAQLRIGIHEQCTCGVDAIRKALAAYEASR